MSKYSSGYGSTSYREMSKRKRFKRKDTKKNYKNAAVYDVYTEEYD